MKMLLTIIAVAAALPTATQPADAQTQEQEDLTRASIRNQRMTLYENGGADRSTQWTRPIRRNADNPLRMSIIQGGVYFPSAFPDEAWLEFACLTETLTEYNLQDHGSSYIRFRVTAYRKSGAKIYDTDDATTILGGAGLCSARRTVDTTFVEVPREIGEEVARMLAIPETRSGQNIVVDRIEYRALLESREAPE